MQEMLNTIVHGNSIELMRTLPDDSVDLIFADPPYWMRVEGKLRRVEGTVFDGCDDDWDNQFKTNDDYVTFTRDWLRECYRILKPNGSFWTIGSMQCIYTIGGTMQDLGFWFINDVVWHKKNPTPNFMGTRLNNSHETLIWATKSRKSKYTFNYKTAKELNTDTVAPEDHAKGTRKQLGSVWRIAVSSGNERLKDDAGDKLHSTQKPEELLYRIIALSSKQGDLVLDPFGGTMTTGAMAKKLGRNYLMLEGSEKYCAYGERRLQNVAFEDSPIARADFDVKPPKVTMQDMIRDGYFAVGEKFFVKNSKKYATLTKSAKLLCDDIERDMHSCAALLKGSSNARLNGFTIWEVVRDGQRILIDAIREKYRADKSESVTLPTETAASRSPLANSRA
jgi:site-specific DNA-methyltransferase (adenine-specific)